MQAAANRHIKANSNFREYVDDKSDIAGMIAYCLYKMKKVEHCTKNPSITDDELEAFCDEHIRGRNFTLNKETAIQILEKVTDKFILHVYYKKRRDEIIVALGTGLITGIICALIANPFWDWVGDLIKYKEGHCITPAAPVLKELHLP